MFENVVSFVFAPFFTGTGTLSNENGDIQDALNGNRSIINWRNFAPRYGYFKGTCQF